MRPFADEASGRHRPRPLFDLFEDASAGAIAVDREARIVWINDRYVDLLGLDDAGQALGRPVEEIIPNSMMREVVRTGRPILLDIMQFKGQSLVVTRIPVHDQDGSVSGAVGFVLYDDLQPLTPLVAKYRRLQKDLAAARQALARRTARYELSDFVGTAPAVLDVKRRAWLAAGRNTPVLITGETGTGKEVLAQAIHNASARAEQPFVGVNVAAVPENLLEAEFFGVAPGAYTGADRRTREGKFQLADGGTLFLDEVGDMPLAVQAKLLRVLQEREVEPLGSNAVRAIDVRVIAATSRDLEAMMADGAFRADLYYRLNVLQIPVPPLRDRLQDLTALTGAMLKEMTPAGGFAGNLEAEALDVLAGYPWPGNIRELHNVLERALILSEGAGPPDADAIRSVLPGAVPSAGPDFEGTAIMPVRSLGAAVADAERAAIGTALRAAGGNKSQAARMLGVPRSVFYEKLRRLS